MVYILTSYILLYIVESMFDWSYKVGHLRAAIMPKYHVCFQYKDERKQEMAVQILKENLIHDTTAKATPYKIALNSPLGTMFKKVNGSPETRFNRFMSLVPENTATGDDKDRSNLVGRMNNLKLGSVAWSDDKIQFAWAMQMNNIEAIRIGKLAQSGGTAAADYAVLHHVNQNH